MSRPVFFISDGTGITAETIGHSLLTQFSGVEFQTRRIAFVDTADKAREAAVQIRAVGVEAGKKPIVVNTVVDSQLSAILAESDAFMMDDQNTWEPRKNLIQEVPELVHAFEKSDE